MAEILHRIGIKAPITAVYQALSTVEGLANWWTVETTGSAAVGGKIEFSFRSENGEVKGMMTMEVKEAEQEKKITWTCLDGPAEWIGTEISFDLSVVDGMTIVMFAHRNWREVVEFMGHCSMKWAVFMLSLRQYLETGKGSPSPGDLKIDNWN